MKKVILYVFTFALTFISINLNAQYILNGKVIDADNNMPLSGANIVVNNKKGCATNVDGTFSINLKKSKNTIQVTYLGYNSFKKNINLSADVNSIDIKLKQSDFTVETVEISAKGFQSEQMRSAARIQSIPQKEISRIPAQKVEEILQYSSGVNVDNTLGMFSDKAVVSMRGMGGENQGRMLVIVDGIPLNKSDGGSVNWNAINKNNLKEIRITQGAASTIYGANAMGGVIDITTKRPDNNYTAAANFNYGTYNTFLADAFVGHSVVDSTQKGSFWNASIHGGTSDGYIIESEEYLEYGEDTLLCPSFFDEVSAEIKAGYVFSASEKVVLSVKGFADKRGNGWQIFDEDGSYTQHNDLDLRLHYNRNIGKSIFWETNGYYRFEKYLKQNEYINSDGDFSMYEIDSKRYDAGVLNTFNFQYGRNLIKTGVDFRYGSVVASDNYFTSTDSIVNEGSIAIGAVFIQDEVSFLEDKIMLTAGMRYDYAAFFDGKYMVYYPSKKINYLLHFQDTLMSETSWSAFSPRLSILYTNKKNVRVYGNFSTGFRPPTLDDMCRSQSSGSYFRVANPNLKDEYIYNMEIGGDVLVAGNTKLSASAYYSIGKDFMYEISTGDSVDIGYKIVPVYIMDNISQMQAYGCEISVNTSINKNITFFANYSYTHSTITEYTLADPEVDYDLNGKYLANVPLHGASAGITWENRWVNSNLMWKFKGERYINDRNTVDVRYFNRDTYPSYQTFSIRFWRQIGYGIEAAVNIDNIANTIYLDNKGRRCPGRMVMLELNWSLR